MHGVGTMSFLQLQDKSNPTILTSPGVLQPFLDGVQVEIDFAIVYPNELVV